MARPGQRQTGARRTAPRNQRRVRHRGDVISVLARTVREVEAAAQRGRVTPAVRTKFQAVALLLREERARVRADGRQRQPSGRAAQAPGRHRDHPREDRRPGRRAAGAARRGRRRLRRGPVAQAGDAAGRRHRAGARGDRAGRRPRPLPPRPSGGSCRSRWSPGSWPTPSSPPTSPPSRQRTSRPRRLAGWELLGPLLSSFERAGGGAPACMALPGADGAAHARRAWS